MRTYIPELNHVHERIHLVTSSLKSLPIGKKQQKFLLFYNLIFSLLFINIFVPYNMSSWYHGSALDKFIHLSGYSALATIVIYLNQFIILPRLKRSLSNLYSLICFSTVELMVISATYFIFYEGTDYSAQGILHEYLYTVSLTLPIWIIIYGSALTIIWIYGSLQKQRPSPNAKATEHLLSIPDENGKITFSINSDDLLYLQSYDNYVMVIYKLNGSSKRELIRNSLKNLEESLQNTNLMRCHRSYMINMASVEMVRKKGSIMELKLKGTDTTIPVSRSFIPAFKALLQ